MEPIEFRSRNSERFSRWLLLSLLILTFSAISPAPGYAQSIGNGEVAAGSVSGTGTQTWTFSTASQFYAHILPAISVAGPSTKFEPGLKLYNPDSTLLLSTFNSANTYGQWGDATPLTQTGSYSIMGWNLLGSTYPTYNAVFTMNINVSNLPFWQSPVSGGGVMYPGVTYNGTQTNANVNIFSFAATAGDNYSVVMTPGGSFPGKSKVEVFAPGGNFDAGGTATSSSTPATAHNASAPSTGEYIVFAFNGSSVGASAPFTLQMTGATKLPINAETDGKPTNAPGGTMRADPINVATGNMFSEVKDYTTVGTNPLAFIRYYNSLSWQHNLYATTLGPNWRSNYDRYLRVVSASLVAAERADGRVINFKLVSSVWTPDTDTDVKLTNSGSTYTLTDSDDTVETYTVTSGKGVLSSIALPNGYTQTMNYTSGVLTSVSDSYSRSLSFTYTSGMLTGVSTPDSATLTYGYTTTASQSLLTSVTYNTSPSTSQTYVYANTELPFALTSITDENSNTYASWTYDGVGRCTMSEHAGGADEVQVSYDDSTGNRTVTGPLGEQETYKYTTLQNKPKVNEIDRAASSPVTSATRTFTYDTNGYLATATDWNGNSTHWTNNSHGLPTSVTEAYGAGIARTTTISYDSTWVHKPYTITKTGVTIDDRYDSSTGNLLTHKLTDTTGGSTNGQTRTWTYTYNATGEMLTAQMPRTGTTVKNTYTYTAGALTSITDQLSHVTTISTYSGGGLPTKVLDPNSVEIDLVYDNRNRLTSKTLKATTNEVTTYTYIGSGQPHIITLPDSSTVTYTYDNAQRLTNIANTAGETINYTLNADGEATTTTIKDSGGTTRKSFTATYDVLGHQLTLVGSGGSSQTTSFTWDGMGNKTSITDANSKTTSLAWDALNRASTVTDALTHTAAPTYDTRDNVTAQTDFNGYSTSFTYDGFDDVIQKVSPDTGTASFVYDEDRNQTKRTDARSVVTNRTFDAVDRITAESFPSYTSENIAYTYDSTTSGNVGIGRLTSVTDESGSTAITYNNFGNITKEVRVIGTQTYTTSYSYDLANRLTEIIYPSGRYVDYTYDNSGYLTTVTTKPTSGGTVTTLASSIVHKPFGPVASFTYGNSEAQTRTFDNNYWLDDLVTTYSGTDIQNLTYGFDNAGNLTSVTDNMAAGRDETYTVDSLNRLHTASGAYGSRTYTYDNNSNRSTRVYGSTTQTSTYTTSTNLLASITDGTNTRHFTYSASGNMATDDRVMDGGVSASFTYGGRDRLESITVGTPTVTFKINAFGQRVEKGTTGLTTDYQYDVRGNLIGENDDSTSNDIVEYVWMEGMLLAQIDSSGNIFYVHSNQVNAPQKITNASRTVVWDYEIEPFGETYATPTNTTPTSHRFPGQYADAEDLLSYNGNRDYDPTLGRYPEADPSGFTGGLNLFGYAGQNPVQAIDPSGLSKLDVNAVPNGSIKLAAAGIAIPYPGAEAAAIRAAALRAAAAAAKDPAAYIAMGLLAITSTTLGNDEYRPQYVVRGGISEAKTLQTNIDELSDYGMPGRYGISSNSLPPPASADDIAMAAPNLSGRKMISQTTDQQLSALGFQIKQTGPNPMHYSILLPPGQTSLTREQAEALSDLFAKRPNPAFKP